VENQSFFICDKCDKRHLLFGEGAGERVAELADAPLLGKLPLDPTVRQWGDAGTPVVQAAPDSDIAKAFVAVAEKLVARLDEHNESSKPSLEIDRSGGQNRHLPISRCYC
jgi:ATP-binding protein involved in chromosome partitioning